MPLPRIARVPDDWTVWAFSDTHGVTSGLLAALRAAGLVDESLHWMAAARTALVGCGDYLDRGVDVRGLVALLRRLEREAATRGGRVILARGNHEAMPLMVRGGAHEWLETWLEYGGDATMASFDWPAVQGHDARGVVAHLESSAPGLFAWLEGLPHAVRWRDVLFVHGGLPPGRRLEDLGLTTDEHLWIRSGFFDTPWDDPVSIAIGRPAWSVSSSVTRRSGRGRPSSTMATRWASTPTRWAIRACRAGPSRS